MTIVTPNLPFLKFVLIAIALRRIPQTYSLQSPLPSVGLKRRACFSTITTTTTMATCSMTKKCVPCEGLDPSAVLSTEEVSKRLETSLPLWKLTPVPGDDDSKSMISKSLVAKTFQAALDALNEMGAIAEREGHHPDFHLTSYRNVQIDLFTHSLQGITENDLTLAELLDQVPIEYSPKWLKEHPAAASHAKTSAPKKAS